mmetsp:Transcript_82908/g.149576  ORF Transcript_82908/g.149576 Transcript_82908/m.149576 type:complete len:291 (-) Transcript_82908:257-1129(-)
MHVQILWRLVEYLGKCLTRQESHGGSIDPRVICSTSHRFQVILAFFGLDPSTGQLPVVRPDAVTGHGSLHLNEGVGGNLVAQTAGARVDHDTHLTYLIDAHLFRNKRIIDLIHNLNLCIVVACPKGSELREASLLRSVGHLGRIRIEHATILLAVFLVFRPRITFAQRPVDAKLESLFQIGLLCWNDALRADTHRDVVEQGLSQALLQRLHIVVEQVCSQQTNSAVDVKANSPRRDHGSRVTHVEGRHVADGKAISTMNIRQTDGVFHDARQGSNIANLLDSWQKTPDVL